MVLSSELVQFVDATGEAAARVGDSESGLEHKLFGFVNDCTRTACCCWVREGKRLVSMPIGQFSGRTAGTDMGTEAVAVIRSSIPIRSVSIGVLDMLAVGDGDDAASGEL